MDKLRSGLLFVKLPAAEARVTVGRVCHACLGQHSAAAFGTAPPRPLAQAALMHGQVAALQHVRESQWDFGHLPVSRLLAEHGHLARVAALQWAQQHGYLNTQDAGICSCAARGGQSVVCAEVVAAEWLYMGRKHVQQRRIKRPPVAAAVGPCKQLLLGCTHVQVGSTWRPHSSAATGARQRLPLE